MAVCVVDRSTNLDGELDGGRGGGQGLKSGLSLWRHPAALHSAGWGQGLGGEGSRAQPPRVGRGAEDRTSGSTSSYREEKPPGDRHGGGLRDQGEEVSCKEAGVRHCREAGKAEEAVLRHGT